MLCCDADMRSGLRCKLLKGHAGWHKDEYGLMDPLPDRIAKGT